MNELIYKTQIRLECFTFTAKVSNHLEMQSALNIPFHRAYQSTRAANYLNEVLKLNNSASDGDFHQKCKGWFKQNQQISNVFLCGSCTDALEFSGLLAGLKSGDEIILPSYTFASTANAFLLRGCTIRFADTSSLRPNVELEQILPHVTAQTKAIVLIHYAGIAIDMDPILAFANAHNILVIEDAAQCIGARYKDKFLGSIAPLGCLSFHPSKIIHCGEGGALLVNQASYLNQAELIFEKGTNRKAFQHHETSFYEWQTIGSSYGMSEFQAAVLFSQLEELPMVINHQMQLWNLYQQNLNELHVKGMLRLPNVPDYAHINGSEFYIVLNNESQRSQLQQMLASQNIQTTTHYRALHRSSFYKNKLNQNLINTDSFESCLLRLPLHFYLTESDVLIVCDRIDQFFKK